MQSKSLNARLKSGAEMKAQSHAASFESQMLPHLDAAYTLAKWLMRNTADAEDLVQESYLRALRFFDGFRGGDSRAWLLQIVRNTCYTRMREKFPRLANTEFQEEIHTDLSESQTPEASAIRDVDVHLVRQAIQQLPANYREILVLRELEDMSYTEIAKITSMPVGGVASSLFRARRLLRKYLNGFVSPDKSRHESLATCGDRE